MVNEVVGNKKWHGDLFTLMNDASKTLMRSHGGVLATCVVSGHPFRTALVLNSAPRLPSLGPGAIAGVAFQWNLLATASVLCSIGRPEGWLKVIRGQRPPSNQWRRSDKRTERRSSTAPEVPCRQAAQKISSPPHGVQADHPVPRVWRDPDHVVLQDGVSRLTHSTSECPH